MEYFWGPLNFKYYWDMPDIPDFCFDKQWILGSSLSIKKN